ncbi:MAG TPA: HD domain-containing phosphohydrolase [Bryobacteraceae bacterium]|nr:HD domain-containing phosphohydrolase [Bryobacteraceae bacterium]
MTFNARIYIAVFLALGFAVLGASLGNWLPTHPAKFAAYFVVALLASVLKVSLPGMAGRMSFNFLFVLMGIVDLALPETLIIGSCALLIESVWRPRVRSTPLQICFAIANMAVAVSCTFLTYHSPYLLLHHVSMPIRLAVATTVFFFVSTFPVSAVTALSEGKSLWKLWQQSYFLLYPYYLAGAALTIAFEEAVALAGWQTALLILPVTYLLVRTYRLYLARVEDEKVHAEQMASLHLRTIEALALAIDAKDNTTHDHLKRVQVYALAVGRELDLSEDELNALRAAALLHDIGKLAVPEHIISKPGKLTPEEFEKMKIHPVVGAEILEHVQFPYPVVPIVRAHHERWNGTGYPYGLRGADIPIGARIIAAVDALDALASDRQYRRALPLDEAMAKVELESGRSFDPAVVNVLKRRYVELEREAQKPTSPGTKLSTDAKISRGDAPAAGFESSGGPVAPGTPAASHDFLYSLAAAREHVQTLFDGDHVSGSDLTLDESLSVFDVRLKRMIPFDALAFYFLQEDKLVPGYVSGDNYRLFSSLRIPIGQGLSGWVAENRMPIINGNPSVEPGYLNDPSVFSTLRSALSLPLEGTAGVIGVLSLYHEGRDAFTKQHLRLLESIMPKLALSVETACRRQQCEDPSLVESARLQDAHSLLVHLEAELTRCKRMTIPLAVLTCRIEGLRKVGERFGEAEMQRVLRAITVTMKGNCTSYDYLARMGSNEFVLVLPGLQAAAVRAKAARLMQISPVAGGETLTLDVGDAYFPDDSDNAEQLMAAADRRLYEVKLQRSNPAAASSQPRWLQ